MCTTCGCSGAIGADPAMSAAGGRQGEEPGHGHQHAHDPDHGHAHHDAEHTHPREHPHGYHHAHDHGHGHLHDLDHAHDHSHDQAHDHSHDHAHDHSHDHAHAQHDPQHAHPHEHPHGYHHAHDHGHGHLHPAHGHDAPTTHARTEQDPTTTRTLQLEQEILGKNRLLAERNRGWLEGREIFAVNLMSSPGSGKTTLLERTIRELGQQIAVSVVEGDQDTRLDAERIRAAGARVVQINTGTGCHLDARMLDRALRELSPVLGSLLFVENVGNLVCPALFDLGEAARVIIASTTEGEDKPLKYPHMFRAADLVLLNKIDLLPHLVFDVEHFLAHVREVNPRAKVFQISAKSGDGLSDWYRWLAARDSTAHPS